MSRNRSWLIGALALLVCATSAHAQSPDPPKPAIAISTLIGLDPESVRARLANLPDARWPAPVSFQVSTPDGVLTFIPLRDLLLDPVLATQMAVWRTHGDAILTAPFLVCDAFLTQQGGAPELDGSIVLIFRNGRFETAFRRAISATPPMPSPLDRKAWMAYLRRPQTSPFIAHFGELPLEDGLGFLSRWNGLNLSPNDKLSAACTPPRPPRRLPPPRGGHGLDASDMQGLALLPFAVTLPSKNRQEVQARQQGAVVLASLHAGTMLDASPEKFAADHRGVRFYRAKTGDYAVLTIDMGGYPGRNLTNFNDSALVGVRDGRVEWISPPDAELRGDLLCLDEHGVPNTPRRGCSGWGHFSP